MNTSIRGNYVKLIAFFLVAALLVAAFGFATEGWWDGTTPDADSSKVDADSNKADNDKNTQKEPENEQKEPEMYIPEFTNALTGLETTEAASRRRHYAFVIDPDSPLYGLSGADLVTEIPVEDGTTRLLAFTNELETLSKIGSLTASRDYISNIAKFFNSAIISKGNDGKLEYDSCNLLGSIFDMSVHTGYYYTEYAQFTYTNGDLVSAGLYNANINTNTNSDKSLPYTFVDFGKASVTGSNSAKSVVIPLSSTLESEFYYSASTKSYSYSRNGVSKKDMLNDTPLSFTNVFILLADTVTYEASDSTEMVMNTIGSGKGYYISEGTYQEITWESDTNGTLVLFDQARNILTVNRGNSYLAFVKSSKASDIKIS
ncbi:MAG: DUF3048 C-terminal domain-containing protein [Clostridia bacterium]|nr:DUF3048 C-terminal domain-containing protein [Clostridia bacterium]